MGSDSRFSLSVVSGPNDLYADPASHNRRAPGRRSGPRGLALQLDHGHRVPVPVEKSTLHVEHEPSLPLRDVAAQRLSLRGGTLGSL